MARRGGRTGGPAPAPWAMGVRRAARCAAPKGFTLVELMIVVAIIGVLASIAVQGVRRYLHAAKTAEAKNNVGQIARGALAAFERELMAAAVLPEGDASGQVAHLLCDSAVPVPAAPPAGRKYQPSSTEDVDFNTGSPTVGWRCVQFTSTQAIYFQYSYTKGSSPVAPASPAACSGSCFEAAARGDLNANGVFSVYARTGFVNVATGALRMATSLYTENEGE